MVAEHLEINAHTAFAAGKHAVTVKFTAHTEHAVHAALPAADVNVSPAEQPVQLEAPPAANVPAEHTTDCAEPPAHDCPPGQLVHTHTEDVAEVVLDDVPAAQVHAAGWAAPPVQYFPATHGPHEQLAAEAVLLYDPAAHAQPLGWAPPPRQYEPAGHDAQRQLPAPVELE